MISETNAEDFYAGLWHPHRGIETITYVLSGTVEHATAWQRRHIGRGRCPMDDGGFGNSSSGNAKGNANGQRMVSTLITSLSLK